MGSLLKSKCHHLASFGEAVGRVCSQAHLGCWQNPIPWRCETGVPISLLVVSCGLLLAPQASTLSLHVSPAPRSQQHTTNLSHTWNLSGFPFCCISLLPLCFEGLVSFDWAHMGNPGYSPYLEVCNLSYSGKIPFAV